MRFEDRADAGRQLAAALVRLELASPVVLALPRGGVPVAYEVAKALKAPLDLVLVRKIGAPWQPELAVGAIVDGDEPELVINEDVRAQIGVADSFLRKERDVQLREIERRRQLYLEGRPPLPVRDCTAILVDDGIATGATMRAALRATRRRQPRSTIVATAVAPPETVDVLRGEADQVVCLYAPANFHGVGQFYSDFRQVDDATVAKLLRQAAEGARESHAP